jgi:hypothetical protein
MVLSDLRPLFADDNRRQEVQGFGGEVVVAGADGGYEAEIWIRIHFP